MCSHKHNRYKGFCVANVTAGGNITRVMRTESQALNTLPGFITNVSVTGTGLIYPYVFDLKLGVQSLTGEMWMRRLSTYGC